VEFFISKNIETEMINNKISTWKIN